MAAKKKDNKKKDKKKEDAGDDSTGGAVLENMQRSDAEKRLAVECRELKQKYFVEERLLNEMQQHVVLVESMLMMEKQKSLEMADRIRDKLREKQELNDKQEYELKVYQEKVKHLLSEHELLISNLRIECEEILKTSENVDRDEQFHLQSNIRSLLIKRKENMLKHGELLNEFKTVNNVNTMKLREEYKVKISNLYNKYNEKFAEIRKRYKAERKVAVKRIESAKNKHIYNLMKRHKQSLNDIKNYYSDIIHSNLDLIKSLKSEILEVQKKEKLKEQQMLEISNINRSLSKPLKKYLSDIETLKGTLKTYDKEKEILKSTQLNIERLQGQYAELQWKHEILRQKYDQEHAEYAVLSEKYEDTVCDVEQKKALKTLILSKSIKQIAAEMEKQDINFNEILSSMNIQQSSIDNVISSKLDDVIKVKDETIRHLDEKQAAAKQKYFAMNNYFENLMQKHNVSPSELGFTPKQI